MVAETACGIPVRRIQHYTAKVVVGPNFVKMSASEAEPASAIQTIGRP